MSGLSSGCWNKGLHPSLSSRVSLRMVHQLVGLLTGAWRCPHDPFHHLDCLAPANLREAKTGGSVASFSACAVTAASAARQQGCLPNSATFPSRRLGQPGTSPTTAAQIRERKTTHPATIPQRHRPSVKRRDSTEAGPPGAPPPPSPHRLSMGAPERRGLID